MPLVIVAVVVAFGGVRLAYTNLAARNTASHDRSVETSGN